MKTKLHSSLALRPSARAAVGIAFAAVFTLFSTLPGAQAQTTWSNALAFDGVNDYVQTDQEVVLSNRSFSVEAWAQRRSSTTMDMVVSQGSGAYNHCLMFGFHYYAGNQFVFDFYGNGVGSGTADIDNAWHHWAGTYDANTKVRCLYRDGILLATNVSPDHYQGAGPIKVGVGPSGEAPNEFAGTIDEVRVWSVARSQAEVQGDMGSPLTGTEPNLLAYWKFDEGSGTTAHDATTNHFDGTLVNGPVWTNSTVPAPPPPFTNVNAGLPGAFASSVAWGDYDNDGKLDLLLAGMDASLKGFAQIWRNTGSNLVNVTATIAPGLPQVGSGTSVAWGDYDNDGRLDFLLTGYGPVSQIWHNTGANFVNVTTTVAPGLPGVHSGSVAWGDYDNDGRLDFILTGSGVSQIWRNTGTGFVNVTATVALGLPGLQDCSVAWGDYDNDGRLDLLVAGFPAAVGGLITQIWRNTGAGFVNVTPTIAPYLPGIGCGCDRSVAWGDYDNDGRLDILLTGNLEGTSHWPVTQVWRNTGTNFTYVDLGLPGLGYGAAVWGDYDNDGRLDLLLSGEPVDSWGNSMGFVCQIWRNTGRDFVNINVGLPGVQQGAVAWGDYDNNGRLDILLTGRTSPSSWSCTSQLWRNNSSKSNCVPAAPTGLAVTGAGSAVLLSWNSGGDAETPAAGLTYNLRVGSTPGGSDLVSPQASATGGRRLPAMGNVQQCRHVPLAFARTGRIYWSVQAVDSTFAGSAFAPESSFTLWPVLGTDAGPVPGDTNGDGMVDQGELDAVLAAYWPTSPWLYLTNTAGLGRTNVTFALNNSTAGAYSVLSSTNLTDWEYLGPATPRYEFTDTNAPAVPQRSYRLRWP